MSNEPQFDTGNGGYVTFNRDEHKNNLVLIVPLSLREVEGPNGTFKALTANVADLDTGEVFLNASGINGAQAEQLGNKIGGNPVLGFLDKYKTKVGRTAWGTRLPEEEADDAIALAKQFAADHPEMFGAVAQPASAAKREVQDDGLAELREQANAA